MQVHSLHLHPHQDLLVELDNWAVANEIEAACILTCVGSLRRAMLRYADQPDGTELEGRFEIVALTGTLSRHGSHYHIAISDGKGQTIGGHLLEGCYIYTTAELVLAEIPDVRFLRMPDPASGYDELYIARGGKK